MQVYIGLSDVCRFSDVGCISGRGETQPPRLARLFPGPGPPDVQTAARRVEERPSDSAYEERPAALELPWQKNGGCDLARTAHSTATT